MHEFFFGFANYMMQASCKGYKDFFAKGPTDGGPEDKGSWISRV